MLVRSLFSAGRRRRESTYACPAKDDPRRCVILELRVITESRPGGDIVYTLGTPESIKKLKGSTITIKEGANYRIKVTFRVQHEIVSGLKYVLIVSRHGIKGMSLLFLKKTNLQSAAVFFLPARFTAKRIQWISKRRCLEASLLRRSLTRSLSRDRAGRRRLLECSLVVPTTRRLSSSMMTSSVILNTSTILVRFFFFFLALFFSFLWFAFEAL